MKSIGRFLVVTLLALGTLGGLGVGLRAGTEALSPQDTGPAIRVMTFNIRYGTADDGANSWPNRRTLVGEIIRRQSPDVLAIQEGLAFQLQELGDVLGGYRKLGQHRDGALEGEFSGLYVNESRVRVLRWGEFWLSPTPDVQGSVGWDAALTRMAIWADLEFGTTGHPLRVYGTHFDHRGAGARLESARLIGTHAEEAPFVIVLGDLNASEDSDPLKAFFDNGYRSAYSMLYPTSETGTFNGFRDPLGGNRIDHILLGPGLKAMEADILTDRTDGFWPSDHFPVFALISWAMRDTGMDP